MSAISEISLNAKSNDKFLKNVIENPDDTILSDKEVYQLKGSDKIFAIKFLCGIGAGLGVLGLTGELAHLKSKQSIKGLTFLYANIACVSTMALVQHFYLKYSGNYSRYKAHQLALYHRLILNFSEFDSNRKAPKIH